MATSHDHAQRTYSGVPLPFDITRQRQRWLNYRFIFHFSMRTKYLFMKLECSDEASRYESTEFFQGSNFCLISIVRRHRFCYDSCSCVNFRSSLYFYITWVTSPTVIFDAKITLKTSWNISIFLLTKYFFFFLQILMTKRSYIIMKVSSGISVVNHKQLFISPNSSRYMLKSKQGLVWNHEEFDSAFELLDVWPMTQHQCFFTMSFIDSSTSSTQIENPKKTEHKCGLPYVGASKIACFHKQLEFQAEKKAKKVRRSFIFPWWRCVSWTHAGATNDGITSNTLFTVDLCASPMLQSLCRLI